MKALPLKFYIRIPNETVFREVEQRLFKDGYKWFCEPRGRVSENPCASVILSGSWISGEVEPGKKEIRVISHRSPEHCQSFSLTDYIQLDQNLERYEVGPKGGVKVKYTPELMGLVANIVSSKNLPSAIHPRLPFISLNSLGELSSSGDGREVDVWEFLKELQALPEIEKILQLHLKEYEVVLTKEKVKVGCQTFTADQFKEIKDAAEAYRKPKEVKLGDGRVALIGRGGLAISGAGTISWEDYEAIIETSNKL